ASRATTVALRRSAYAAACARVACATRADSIETTSADCLTSSLMRPSATLVRPAASSKTSGIFCAAFLISSTVRSRPDLISATSTVAPILRLAPMRAPAHPGLHFFGIRDQVPRPLRDRLHILPEHPRRFADLIARHALVLRSLALALAEVFKRQDDVRRRLLAPIGEQLRDVDHRFVVN